MNAMIVMKVSTTGLCIGTLMLAVAVVLDNSLLGTMGLAVAAVSGLTGITNALIQMWRV